MNTCRQWFFLVITALLAACLTASAEISHTEISEARAGASVTYAQMTSAPNAFAQDNINRIIFDKGEIAAHLATLETLDADSGFGLTVDCPAAVYPRDDGRGVFACVVRAVGKMPNGRFGQRNTPMNFEIASGREIVAEDIFTDVAGAQAYLDDYVARNVADSLSAYMDAGDVLPVPMDRFLLSDTGITFYYPQNQLTMLSGYSGALHLYHEELLAQYDLAEGSVMRGLGVAQDARNGAEEICKACAAGSLPGLPAVIGENLALALDRYRAAADADYIPGSSLYGVEEAVFRGVLLMTRAQSDDLQSQTVSGIRAFRASLGGLMPGKTARETCLGVLGAPDSTVMLDDNTANLYRLSAGQSDRYEMGDYALTLYYDTENMLICIELTMAK